MKIALFGQFFHRNAEEAITILLNYLNGKSNDIYIEENFLDIINKNLDTTIDLNDFKTFKTLNDSYNLLISIGGDGTILRAITHVKDTGVPIVGINTGRLGFLATIQNENITHAMDDIFNGNYKISKRSLLEIKTTPKHQNLTELNFALNEIAISRKNTTSMITVSTKLDEEYLTSYWSDGLIVSTPTGSTGYSLSCGGPVIAPDAESFVLTPIAPHNLNARPLVITDTTEIELKVDGRENEYLVSLDSRIATLQNDAIITIKKAPFKIKMIELATESFLDTLRKKLLWGEDKRN
ncbi:NAD kinase [Mangrovimonas spongiae]|uniref:NAD kinase n=1 Tax=Mangrovimonas spongiae TaxID=2494697 RepID=A0A3R9NR51_9FLAO|nr:NAD kinase [Mangrovimonas spongiae]RSK39820.1 NAD kinase [Mangrovimonas spongiae]